jgi:hypothetical protein
MSENEQIIVLVQDSGDASHGEISVLENWEKAERLIETLLEAGFQGERIQVFRGRQNEFQISHRPVVSFGAGATPAAGGQAPAAQRPAVVSVERPQSQEPPPKAEQPEPAEAAPEPKATAQAERAEEAPQAEAPQREPEGVPEADEEPAQAGAVRFSSLFRSA